jgi:hypothetical protein
VIQQSNEWDEVALRARSLKTKESNPKDGVGSRKWRQLSGLPTRVLWEVGVAMLEGALKYGRHNYRYAGVRATVYTDAALGHITQWLEGEDIDADSHLSHITKAITSLIVLRDGMIEGNFVDDRPMKHSSLDAHRAGLQAVVDKLLEQYPTPAEPFLETTHGRDKIDLSKVITSGSISADKIVTNFAIHPKDLEAAQFQSAYYDGMKA